MKCSAKYWWFLCKGKEHAGLMQVSKEKQEMSCSAFRFSLVPVFSVLKKSYSYFHESSDYATSTLSFILPSYAWPTSGNAAWCRLVYNFCFITLNDSITVAKFSSQSKLRHVSKQAASWRVSFSITSIFCTRYETTYRLRYLTLITDCMRCFECCMLESLLSQQRTE